MGVSQATKRETRFGPVFERDGWFVVNARETRWRVYGPLGAVCDFEGKRPFLQLGINLNVLMPGQPMAMYHREAHQEGFLVLSGECLLIVQGEERPLRAWDYVHCPGGTEHVLVGAGDRPAIVLAVGARGGRKGIVYTVSEAALRHGAGVKRETTKSAEAYARFPAPGRSAYREGWLPQA